MPQVLKEEVKKRIIDSAIRVFKKDNYRKASMNEIAKYADVSVGNIYRYFDNKKNLYDYIVKDIYKKLTEILEFCQNKDDSLDLMIENCINEFVDMYSKDKDVFIILINSDDDLDQNQTIISSIRNILSNNLITVMKKRKENFTKYDEIFCKTLAVAVANGVRYIVTEDGSGKKLEKRLRFYLEFMKRSFINEIS
ncbi:MAG: TetR/AcrR family transcriptional regulator [Tissierellales bacterium]|nr:TetR/AcrR family transcriptional regulator [Tissierellales bacterium]